jgi:putative flippase GtrA
LAFGANGRLCWFDDVSIRRITVSDTLGKLLRYTVTGGSAAVIDLGAFALLYPAVLSLPLAATASFLLAAVENYVFTSYFVYKQPLGVRRFGAFLLTALIGLSVNVGITSVAATFGGFPPLIAKTTGIGAAFLLNFSLNTLIVFRKKGVSGANI